MDVHLEAPFVQPTQMASCMLCQPIVLQTSLSSAGRSRTRYQNHPTRSRGSTRALWRFLCNRLSAIFLGMTCLSSSVATGRWWRSGGTSRRQAVALLQTRRRRCRNKSISQCGCAEVQSKECEKIMGGSSPLGQELRRCAASASNAHALPIGCWIQGSGSERSSQGSGRVAKCPRYGLPYCPNGAEGLDLAHSLFQTNVIKKLKR
mmetsp:Transcript_7351/g.17913  ORF Transcript_7351/g.17913 Transcript_7351/m.17913 type:complete len:205 (-) Transcript_7351:1897-2511(-)